MITEAMENTFVNKVKAFMHQFKRVGAGHWEHDTKSKLYDFKYDKGNKTLTISAINKKDGKSEQKSFKGDSYGLIKYMGTLFDSTGTLTEEATAGATCAANIATVSQPIGSTVKRKKKEPRYDVEMFKKSIKEDTPCACKINGRKLKYEMSEGSGFLYVDNCIAKTLSKKSIIECVDNLYYNNKIDVELLENYSINELVTLLSEELVGPQGLETPEGTEEPQEFTPDDEKEINDMRANPTQTLNIIDDKTKKVIPQQFDGVDDVNHKIILKDPTRPDVKRSVNIRNIVKDKNEAI